MEIDHQLNRRSVLSDLDEEESRKTNQPLNLELLRSRGPIRWKINGIGAHAARRKASNPDAQRFPSFSYIWTVNRGNAAAIADLTKLLPAIADAA